MKISYVFLLGSLAIIHCFKPSSATADVQSENKSLRLEKSVDTAEASTSHTKRDDSSNRQKRGPELGLGLITLSLGGGGGYQQRREYEGIGLNRGFGTYDYNDEGFRGYNRVQSASIGYSDEGYRRGYNNRLQSASIGYTDEGYRSRGYNRLQSTNFGYSDEGLDRLQGGSFGYNDEDYRGYRRVQNGAYYNNRAYSGGYYNNEGYYNNREYNGGYNTVRAVLL